LNRSRTIVAALCAAVSLLCVMVVAQGAERFRLTEWPDPAAKPDFHLRDMNHARRSMADYHGRVSVVFFGFTHCPDVCPTELYQLSLVIKQLGPSASRVQVLFITLDPQRDTPPVLQAYVRAFDPRFLALTGSSADINAAASSFSVQFAKVTQGSDYTIDHSTGTYVLDKTGHLRLVATLQASVDDWVHDLTVLAAE
jgi:protein SCO1